mmetsp:Transcript_15086/g.29375  ORF Transcript_15086/g.29375 Transcript_15086/m.29375 type:complete len:345 (+) Transcript_15086:228-1262(+)|eukprot:CAMPEP_0171512330 /NCGR_PEP_ID=MMETSP0959-20130129/1518_1 /TAXON_ID=87120 /ORGANISM="Aurantiochytrium limacinum, Strain ATCCMYA-1381" /LENGTH=344 /DNA_ID=CAMNT_0012050111 /DNA_START=197 /DNA_END=1231 /DNA_ORIENTATION=+
MTEVCAETPVVVQDTEHQQEEQHQMEPRGRKVTLDDREDVANIVKLLFGGNDYINSCFDAWVEAGQFYGLEEYPGGPLVSIANVARTACGGYVEGVRSDPTKSRRGYGMKLMIYLLENSKVEELRYQTFDQNIASIRLADRSGFNEMFRYRYSFLSGPQFVAEPYAFGFDEALDVHAYLDKLEKSFGVSTTELTKTNDPTVIVKALEDIDIGVPVIYLHARNFNYSEIPGVFESNDTCTGMISPAIVSIGYFEEDHEPLGKTLSYSMFISTKYEPTRDELWAHAAYWTRYAAELNCDTMCIHTSMGPTALEADLGEILGRERQLIIFNQFPLALQAAAKLEAKP